MKLIPIKGKANANLYRHPDTDIIYLWMSKKGKGRIQKSTGTSSLTDARRIADDLKYEFLGERNPKLGRKLNRELVPEWLETKRVLRASTYDRYLRSWEHVRPWAEDLAPEDLTESWWTTIYIPGKRSQLMHHYFFNDKKMVFGYLGQCQNDGYIKRLPKFINPDPKSNVGKVYSDAEIGRLLDEASEDLKLQILMALEMFMRKGEILLLALNRIDRRRRLIALRAEDCKTGSRTGKGRTFPITDRVWQLIEPKLFHRSGYLFPSRTGEEKPVDKGGNQSAWEGAKERAKVTGRFHDLRHTALSKALTQPGSNIALICRFAGITLEEAERTYLHTNPDQLWEVAESAKSLWGKLG
jgi:integrase